MKNRKKAGNLTAREITLRLLLRIEKKGAYADRLLSAPRIAKLDKRNRGLIRELLLGVLRWKLRLDHIIDTYYNKQSDTLAPGIRNILRLGLFQIMFLNSVPEWAAVNESVNMASVRYGRKGAGLVNALLRRFEREGEPPFPSDPLKHLSVEMSHPLWLVNRWKEYYGEEAAKSICRAGNEKHPICIRTARLKIAPEELTERLSEEGFKTAEVPGMHGYRAVLQGEGLFDTETFKEGLFTVQDPAAGMAAELLAPVSGETIIDLCAAPGGKATQCAELMCDSGKVIAVDIHPARLGLVRNASDRLGLASINCAAGDALVFTNDRQTCCDRVLLDTPCTGTGVLSKRLDMRWHLSENDIHRLAVLQENLLENAASAVKPGGVLVYSTCSLEPEENEEIVAVFLEHHKEFSIERDNRFKDFEREFGYLIFPFQMCGGGAFAARLRHE
ncbi:16S rRNA (cytosine(967)-C(5))-methyltransferase RsmB [Candidatus Latescibacterota bacterium]